MKLHILTVLLLLSSTAGGRGAGGLPPRRPSGASPAAADELRVTLPKGAQVKDAVSALGRTMGGVVAADAEREGGVPLELQAPLQEAPLKQALAKIRTDLDRYWVRRGPTLALQREYSDPDAGPALEMEELRQVASHLAGLTQPFGSHFSDVDYILAKRTFVKSLTPEQQQQMLGGGLPFRALPAAQQALWLQINWSTAYSDPQRELRRAALCLGQWGQVTAETRTRPGLRPFALQVRFPDPAQANGQDGLSAPLVYAAGARGGVIRPGPPGRTLKETAAKPPASLQPVWNLETQELGLEKLAQKLKAAGGPGLSYPEYASERRFWVVSRGGTRAQVLSALADLWGWEVSTTKEGVRIGRPPMQAAKDGVDLHRKLRQAIPPALGHIISNRQPGHFEWRNRQCRRYHAAADRVAGADWTRFRPTDLDAPAQRALANMIMLVQVDDWFRLYGDREEPPLWMVRPELGFFQLTGPLGPGAHPSLGFYVPEERGTLGWNWSIGTSTLPE